MLKKFYILGLFICTFVLAEAGTGVVRIETPTIYSVENGDDLVISPNPASSFIQIKTQNNKNIVRVSVLTSLGSTVLDKKYLSTSEVKLKVQKLKKGRYFVRVIFSDNHSLTSTILKV